MNDKKNYQIKFLLFIIILFASGCSNEMLYPPGDIASEQIKLLVISTSLMLIVVIPAICMSLFFAYKYRKKNKSIYKPNFMHSKLIEFIIWAVPILIIIFLSVITWRSTHDLEPSKEITKINKKPLEINVISFDWKWLFVYPQQKIATINYIVLPINTPVVFRITSNTVMNSFFIPGLGSQVYAMAGMENKLNLISNKESILKGFSANFSGKGFSDMKFKVISTDDNKFVKWINKIKKFSQNRVSIGVFKTISSKSINNYIEFFSDVNPKLFEKIISNHHIKK